MKYFRYAIVLAMFFSLAVSAQQFSVCDMVQLQAMVSSGSFVLSSI